MQARGLLRSFFFLSYRVCEGKSFQSSALPVHPPYFYYYFFYECFIIYNRRWYCTMQFLYEFLECTPPNPSTISCSESSAVTYHYCGSRRPWACWSFSCLALWLCACCIRQGRTRGGDRGGWWTGRARKGLLPWTSRKSRRVIFFVCLMNPLTKTSAWKEEAGNYYHLFIFLRCVCVCVFF